MSSWLYWNAIELQRKIFGLDSRLRCEVTMFSKLWSHSSPLGHFEQVHDELTHFELGWILRPFLGFGFILVVVGIVSVTLSMDLRKCVPCSRRKGSCTFRLPRGFSQGTGSIQVLPGLAFSYKPGHLGSPSKPLGEGPQINPGRSSGCSGTQPTSGRNGVRYALT